jgi:membrane associated rhomboid family serine protease
MIFSLVIYIGILHKNVAIIGASGAVMGLMSTAMLIAPFSITWEMLFPIPTMIKGWMFFYADFKGFLGGEADGISHLAHLCGFLSIMIMVYFLSNEDRTKLTGGLVVNLISLGVATWIRQKYFI